jgi:hypothetical protein
MKSDPRKLVAVAVPVSKKPFFSPSEKISLHHLLSFLGRYDKFFVAPVGSSVSHPELQNKYFDNKFFGSAEAHSKLLLSSKFYKSFIDYEYILIYHLDALVFSDKLTEWCLKEYDYIAPPWIEHRDAPYFGMPEFEGKIGNGGFSLRRVKNFLKVINSNKYYIDPDEYWRNFCQNKSKFEQIINLPRKYIKQIPIFNNAKTEIIKKIKIEDMFWANRGQYYYPEFKIAPIKVALEFAFECVPRYCYRLNNNQLPFGCHAWEKYDKSFWDPYMLQEK